MTTQNLFHLAKAGKLGQSLSFEGYCVSAAIDACFESHDVPTEVYEANRTAVEEGELGNEGSATDRFYELLGSLAFMATHPEEFRAVPYYFNNLEELRTDLEELRGNSTILLGVNDDLHSVGLKPIGDNPDKWKIVGTHQLIAVKSLCGPMDVQDILEPETITTSQVWDYLVANNSHEAGQQTALIFPPEPL